LAGTPESGAAERQEMEGLRYGIVIEASLYRAENKRDMDEL
jgi:hypothetical protein